MTDIEHPIVTQIRKTGYANLVAQEEHFGTDYFGDEVVVGEDYVEDSNNNEIIRKDNLERYLSEVYGYKFSIAD